jgi:hypothetical protein
MYHDAAHALFVPVSAECRPVKEPDMHATSGPDRGLVLNVLYASCTLIVLGAVVGILGARYVDPQTGGTLGTAVLGAGAALLPTGIIGGTRSAGAGAAAGAGSTADAAGGPLKDGTTGAAATANDLTAE